MKNPIDYRRQLAVILCVAGLAYIPAATARRPTTPAGRVFAMYLAGKCDDARKAAIQMLPAGGGDKYVPGTGSDTREQTKHALITYAEAAFLMRYVVAGELRKAPPGNPTPEQLLRAAEGVGAFLGRAIDEFLAARPSLQDKEQRYVQSIKSTRKDLITGTYSLLTKLGQDKRAATLRTAHAALFKIRNLPSRVPVPLSTASKNSHGKHIVVTGDSMNALTCILGFYRALADEDAEALNDVLYAGSGYLTGEQLVEALHEERQRERDFDKLLLPRFDAQTRVSIARTEAGVLDVRVVSIMKRATKGSKTIEKRENDRFLLKPVKGAYRLMLPNKNHKQNSHPNR